MTSAASDILAVYLMQKEANIENKLRVVPLFETLQDLKNAKSIMEKLFSLGWYRKLIQNKQEIMIGYSDSSKDAGKLSASWHQYKLQEEVLKLQRNTKSTHFFSWQRRFSRSRRRSNSSNNEITTTKISIWTY
jgi:phosphoenolpyruvate carboxylase